MERWTIYCHTHVESGRKYVGLTKYTMMRRWHQHCAQAKCSKGKSHFANAIRKHGKDAFSHVVLETCETLDAANAAEERWISDLGTRDATKGFNLARGGLHTPHPIRNPWDRPEFRAKQLKSGKRKWLDPEFRRKLVACGKVLSEDQEFKDSVGKAVKAAYERNPGTKDKISDSIRKMWEDPDYREKTSGATKEAIQRPESRGRISRGTRAAAQTLENKEARSRASRALWSDPAFRSSMSAGARERAADPAWRSKCAPKNHASSAKTHCKRGHELVGGNVNSYRGARICRACQHVRYLEKLGSAKL